MRRVVRGIGSVLIFLGVLTLLFVVYHLWGTELGPNDPIYVVTRQGQFRYEVIEKKIVSPKDVSVLDATPDNRLTLTTCTPKYSAAQRLIVVARLAGPSAPAATAALTPTVTT